MTKRAVIIGGGLGGLATACLLGKAGYRVTVLEQNEQLGGRAGILKAKGFTFDTGPSWYLMPDVFEHFFALLGERLSDHLDLVRLDPAYRIFYKDTDDQLDITADLTQNAAAFEAIEPGAGRQLRQYLAQAERGYTIAQHHILYKNMRLHDVFSADTWSALRAVPLATTMYQHVRQYIRNPHLQKTLMMPSVFLGVSPYRAPALYSLLNHTLFTQGAWYPKRGIYTLVDALVAIGRKHGVVHRTNAPVERILVKNGAAKGVNIRGGTTIPADVVISNADISYTETHLLGESYRDHSEAYWSRRTLAPSALLLYLGVAKQYSSLAHHNLLFSENWRQNFDELFKSTTFPTDPSLYVCAPSKTDPSVAPHGHENLFVLVPVAAGITYTPQQLKTYAGKTLATMEHSLGLPGLRQAIVYQKLFCVNDFAGRFHSPQGTGLGLAHTLRQTAFLRPANTSKKVAGLYHAGATVSPGIGMPSVLISAELLYKQLCGDRSAGPLTSL